MRWSVWCVASLLSACGKSESSPDEPAGSGRSGAGAAAAGTTSTAGSSGSSSAGNGAAPVSGQPGTGGSASGSSGQPGTGGASTSGGTGNAGGGNTGAGTGGDEAGSAGAGEDGGTGGDASAGTGGSAAGSGGSSGSGPAACETYNACGCGCCDPSPRDTACVYPDNGEDFAAIIAEDRAAALDPSCEDALCERGTRHFCCAVPGVEPSATYEASSWVGGQDHITVVRVGSDGRCTEAGLSYPSGAPGRYPFESPPGWALNYLANYPCEEQASDDYSSIGVIGWMRWTTEDECAVDFDFTGFFRTPDGILESMRFAGEQLRIEGYGAASCDP